MVITESNKASNQPAFPILEKIGRKKKKRRETSVLSVNTFGVSAGSNSKCVHSLCGLGKAEAVWEVEVCIMRSVCAHSLTEEV